MYKVRFHLAKGKNYMHWQVLDTDTNERRYYNPNKYQLVLYGCYLHNNKKTAQKIFDGANKSVCAWVQCEEVIVSTITDDEVGDMLQYNPRDIPFWTNIKGEDLDKTEYKIIKSVKNKLYVQNKQK
jgi:hypothetical protein